MQMLRKDSGAILVVTLFFVLVTIALSAVVIDLGYLFNVRRHLQATADAATLAACRELILGEDDAVILGVAEHYAEDLNAVKPAEDVEMIEDAPLTEVTEEYVKVTVKQQTDLLVAPALSVFGGTGFASKEVQAQAKCRPGYLGGLAGLIPLSIPIITTDRVVVRIDDGPEIKLNGDPGDLLWDKMLDFDDPLGGAENHAYEIDVIAYNSHNIGEVLSPAPNRWAATVVVQQNEDRIQDVALDQNYIIAGEVGSVELEVQATPLPGDQVLAVFDKKKYTLSSAGGGTYSVDLDVPQVLGLYESFPIDVCTTSSGSCGGGYEIRDAVTLVVRRSTYPIKNVSLNQTFFLEGGANTTNISVEISRLVKDKDYEIKVGGGGGEVGNFTPLDFNLIFHGPPFARSGTPEYDPPGDDPDYSIPPTPAFPHYLAHPFPFEIHVGDIIWTETGAAVGQARRLKDRFGGDKTTFAEWDAAGRPDGSVRVVGVPIVEKIEKISGQTAMEVISFGSFYVEPDAPEGRSCFQKCNPPIIYGRFIDYMAPGGIVLPGPPDDEFYILAPHLVPDGVDF